MGENPSVVLLTFAKACHILSTQFDGEPVFRAERKTKSLRSALPDPASTGGGIIFSSRHPPPGGWLFNVQSSDLCEWPNPRRRIGARLAPRGGCSDRRRR